jgi:hypothetical protein
VWHTHAAAGAVYTPKGTASPSKCVRVTAAARMSRCMQRSWRGQRRRQSCCERVSGSQ